MTDEAKDGSAPKIIVDSDWKKDAAEEKSRLEEETRDVGKGAPLPEPSLLEIVNMIVMQATMALGGVKTPSGETLPPDPGVAKHYIDMLELLKNKTAGNITDQEHKLLDTLLHELRMQYVTAVKAPPSQESPTQADV